MKKTILAVVITVMFCLIFSGCGPKLTYKTDSTGADDVFEGMKEATLYFPNEDNSALASEKRKLAIEDNDKVKVTVEALIKGPTTKGLKKSIPDGTKLLSARVEDGTAVVDFSKEYTSEKSIPELIERVSLVNTLTEIDGIEKVKILVEGKDLADSNGEPIGELMKVDLDEDGKIIVAKSKSVILYFGDSDAEEVVAEKRDILVDMDSSVEKAILEELRKGPKNGDLSPSVPVNTKVLSASTKDGICTVNLSKDFASNSLGSAGETITIYSIVNSLTELENVKQVQFLIEGNKIESLGHMDFSEPFERNESIIAK